MLRAYRNWEFPKGLREVGEEAGIGDLDFAWGELR